MGHIRLGVLPRTRKWQAVVQLLTGDASLADIVGASADAAENSLKNAATDDTLSHAFWLLTQLPQAARFENFSERLWELGLRVSDRPSLLESERRWPGRSMPSRQRYVGVPTLGRSPNRQRSKLSYRSPAAIFLASSRRRPRRFGTLLRSSRTRQTSVYWRETSSPELLGAPSHIFLVANCRTTSDPASASRRRRIAPSLTRRLICIADRPPASSKSSPAAGMGRQAAKEGR